MIPTDATEPKIETASEVPDVVRRARELAQHPEGLREARELLEAELRANPESWPVLEAEVEVLSRLRDDRLAIRLLEEYIRCFPEHSLASARLAWVHAQAGRRDEALAEIAATVARDPNCREAWLWYALWAGQKSDWPLVVKATTSALQHFPEDVELLRLLGDAHARQHRDVEAEGVLRQAYELDPHNESVVSALARVLLALKRHAEAVQLLDGLAANPSASPEIWLQAADALFRANQPSRAIPFLERLHTDPRADTDTLQHRAIEVGSHSLGNREFERIALQLLAERRALDSFALEFLEFSAGNRGAINAAWKEIGVDPLRYPRATARFLTTFHSALMVPGAMQRWVDANSAAIAQNTHIWGAVGAWLCGTKRYKAAADHLATWWQRRDARPWMVLVMGRALEAMGLHPQANAQYRAALKLPPDHSEIALRTRLAFNMALEGYAASGHLIIQGCCKAGRQLAGVDDAMRAIAVESLMRAERTDSPDERLAILEEGVARISVAMGRQGGEELRAIIRTYRERGGWLVSQARARE